MNQNEGDPRKVSFSDFVFLQSQQALMSMGQFPNPMTGKYEENLFIAQYVIDILAMLEEKTQGNLDENESKLLENVLHELRMTYVEKARESEQKGTAAADGAEEAKPEGGAGEAEAAQDGGAERKEASEASGPAGEEKNETGPGDPPGGADSGAEDVIQMPPPSGEESPENPDKEN